jgi:hypothetical protein
MHHHFSQMSERLILDGQSQQHRVLFTTAWSSVSMSTLQRSARYQMP